MGFGYGTKINEYRIKPGDLPRRIPKKHIRFLKQRDRKAFKECCDRYFMKHHGMFQIKKHEIEYFFGRPEAKTVVYGEGMKILGYLSFVFKKTDKLLQNNLVIRELIYENPYVLSELLAFLNTQADQISQIIFPTQEESFHFLPFDPRDGTGNIIPIIAHQTNTQGIGIMYRVIDTKRVFRILKNHNFNNQNCTLKISLRDSFLPQNEGSILLQFKNGFPLIKHNGKHDVEVRMNIADFSSLIMGVVQYRNLFEYGLSQLSDEAYLDVVEKIFSVAHRPICHTIF